MTDVVITAARRTPVGSFLGAFANTPAHELGRVAIEAALGDAGVEPGEVSEVILGQVLTAAQGQNPARQAAMAAGIPKEVPPGASSRCADRACARSRVASQSIALGDASIVVAGGQENMSMAPHAQALRAGRQDGRRQPDRHHAQGRADGRLQRLSHGHHRRESRRAISDRPRGAGRLLAALADPRRRRARRRPVRRRNRTGDDQGPQGRHHRQPRRIHPRRHHRRSARRLARRVQEGRQRHRRQRQRDQRRRRRAWC